MDTALSKFGLSPWALIVVFGLIFILGALSGPFLNEAGKDLYVWFKRDVLKRKPKDNAPSPTPSSAIVAGTTGSTMIAGGSVVIQGQPRTGDGHLERISRVTFEEVREAFNKAPPLQQAHISSQYAGLRVQWEGIFNSAAAYGDETTVRMYVNGLGTMVTFSVTLDHYPELKLMHTGRRLRVLGTIKAVDSISVDLVDAEMTVLD